MIFVVVLLGIAGVVGSELIQSRTKTVQVKKMKHDQAVLQMAKQALLGYAVKYHTAPGGLYDMGRLPCPDYTELGVASEGTQDGPCGAIHVNAQGFLPWKTLGLDSIKDSNGDCLWYVVSGDYKDRAEARMLNEDTNGLLKVQDENGQLYNGANPDDRPIALIIAPGPLLSGQDRTPSNNALTHCRGNYGDENEYLESGGSVNYTTNHVPTADTIWTYVYGTLNNDLDNTNYNDRMVWITKSEYWDAVKAQGDLEAADPSKEINILTQKLAQCLAGYANDISNENHWLPWPAPIGLADYRTDSLYADQDDPSDLMGRFPTDITNSNTKEGNETSSAISVFPDMTDILSTCLLPDDKMLWQNWKDHFFYVVSEEFKIDGATGGDLTTRCSSGKCVTIAGLSDDLAGIVFYANSVEIGESRSAGNVGTDPDEKQDITQYLSSIASQPTIWNAHQYPNDAAYTGAGGVVNQYYRDLDDITYCIKVSSSTKLEVSDCS